MSNDPLVVSLTKVIEFLRDIGLDPVDPRDIRSVHFDPDCLTVVRYRRNAAGHKVVAGPRQVATETTTIRVEDWPRQPTVIEVTTVTDRTPQYVIGER